MAELSADAYRAYCGLVYETEGLDRDRQSEYRPPPLVAPTHGRDRRSEGDPMGVQLGTMPADAAGLARFRQRGRELARDAAQGRRHGKVAGDVPRVAVLSDAALQHGHGIGQERHRIASRYAELVCDDVLRTQIFSRLRAERQSTVDAPLATSARKACSKAVRRWRARSANRFPYIDPLNHMQIELLRRYRAGDMADQSSPAST
jgi:hypothetical protein